MNRSLRPVPEILAGYEPLELIDPRPPAFSDDALALRYCDRHENDLRFVAAWGKWFRWEREPVRTVLVEAETSPGEWTLGEG
jgi:hypothetical protein